MGLTRIRQDHIWSENAAIDDTLAPADHDANAVDLKDTVDYLASQLADMLGETNWTDAPDLSISTMAAKTWLDDKKALRDYLHLQDISVPAAQNWVVLSATGSETPTRPIAKVGTTSGAVAAELAGDVGSHALTEVAGSNALNPENLCMVFDGSTGDPIKSSERQVYALLQCENGATDGGAWTDSTNQGQLSFVRPNATYDDLEACPVADIASTSINYVYADRETLSLWAASDFRRSSVLLDLAAPGVSVTMDVAYDGGSQVDVDDSNVDFRLTDTKHFYISDVAGAARILDVHAEAAGDEIDINAPGGIDVSAGDLTMSSSKATINGVEVGGAAGQVATLSGDLVLDGADDITFTTVRETTPLPLDDTTNGPISGLTGGPFTSISDAIAYAIESGTSLSIGVTVLASNYAQDANIPGGAGGLDISSGNGHSIDMNTPSGVDTIVFLNGRLLYGGNDTTQNDAYAGTDPSAGDIKVDFPRGVKSGDVFIAIQFSA